MLYGFSRLRNNECISESVLNAMPLQKIPAPHANSRLCKNFSLIDERKSGTLDAEVDLPSASVTLSEIVGSLDIPLGREMNESALSVPCSELIARSPSPASRFCTRERFFHTR